MQCSDGDVIKTGKILADGKYGFYILRAWAASGIAELGLGRKD
jgi:hypothetical protein